MKLCAHTDQQHAAFQSFMDNQQFTDLDSGSAALYIYIVVYNSNQTNYIWEKNNFHLQKE